MATLLQQLENNEAILLMYIAGELDPAGTREVEALLQRDAALRAELQKLRELHDESMGTMARLDELSSARPRPQALPQLLRAMREHVARAPEKAKSDQGLRFPWWVYPMAAAASIMVALLVWWTNLDVNSYMPAPHNIAGRSWHNDGQNLADTEDDRELARGIVESLGDSRDHINVLTRQRSLDRLDESIIALSQDEMFFFNAGN